MPFEGSDGFSFALAAVEAAFVVGAAFGAGAADLGDGGGVDGAVQLAVASSVEPVADDSSAAGLDGAVPLAMAKRSLVAKRAGSPTSARISAAVSAPMP